MPRGTGRINNAIPAWTRNRRIVHGVAPPSTRAIAWVQAFDRFLCLQGKQGPIIRGPHDAARARLAVATPIPARNPVLPGFHHPEGVTMDERLCVVGQDELAKRRIHEALKQD
jgi:hypothetical protein